MKPSKYVLRFHMYSIHSYESEELEVHHLCDTATTTAVALNTYLCSECQDQCKK